MYKILNVFTCNFGLSWSVVLLASALLNSTILVAGLAAELVGGSFEDIGAEELTFPFSPFLPAELILIRTKFHWFR